jgi:hypothetical protein
VAKVESLTCGRTRSVLTSSFAGGEDEMSDDFLSRERYGEAFWRSHHEGMASE